MSSIWLPLSLIGAAAAAYFVPRINRFVEHRISEDVKADLVKIDASIEKRLDELNDARWRTIPVAIEEMYNRVIETGENICWLELQKNLNAIVTGLTYNYSERDFRVFYKNHYVHYNIEWVDMSCKA